VHQECSTVRSTGWSDNSGFGVKAECRRLSAGQAWGTGEDQVAGKCVRKVLKSCAKSAMMRVGDRVIEAGWREGVGGNGECENGDRAPRSSAFPRIPTASSEQSRFSTACSGVL